MPDRQEQAPRMDPGYHIVPRVAADLNGALEPTVPLGFSFTLLSLPLWRPCFPYSESSSTYLH